MATQKKLLASILLLAFFLTFGIAVDSHAKKKQSPRKDLVRATVSGTIADVVTVDAEFDFLLIQSGDSDQWVAAPKKEKGFRKGDTVSCDEGVVLKNYHIKGLKRRFKNIVFTECK